MRRLATERRHGHPIDRGGPPQLRTLRMRTGAVLAVAVLGAVVAWVAQFLDRPESAVLAWRLAFFCALTALLLNASLLKAVWEGRAHLWCNLSRPVPFDPAEFREGTTLDPGRARGGAVGRGGLVGVGLMALAGLVWLGGLGLAPPGTSGTVELRVGQRTSDVRPFGFHPAEAQYAYVLPHQHTVMGVTQDGGGVLMQAVDPHTGETGEYELREREPVLLGPHRIHLAAISTGPPAAVQLRFTEAWVWWWRLVVLTLAAAGLVLAVSVPHRTWVWVGQPGDYQLRAWSLNAAAGLRQWSSDGLAASLGSGGYVELESIEAELARAEDGTYPPAAA